MKRQRTASAVSGWGAALGACACAVLGLLVLMSSWGLGFSYRSYDLLQRLKQKPDLVPQDLVIVSMDDRSFLELHQNPTQYWDRSLHAKLVRRLTEEGASVIVFDILFNAPEGSSDGDKALVEAMRAHGKVAIATMVEDQTSQAQALIRQPQLPDESFRQHASWGAVEYKPDADGIVRRVNDSSDFVSLARRAAEMFRNTSPNNAEHGWLRYYGPAGSLKTVSYCDALTPSSLPTNWCRGKVVFVGHGRITPPKHTSIPDEFKTPLGTMSGVEIQATTCANLLYSQSWREASPGSEFAMMLILGLTLGLLSRVRDVRTAIGMQVAVILGTLLIAAMVLNQSRIWIPWLIPLGIQTPFAMVWTSAFHFLFLRRENTHLAEANLQLERKLESYPDHTPANARLHTLSGAPTERVALLIPDYSLIKVIGSGAYGEVWLARSLVGSYVAIKILFRDRFEDAEPYEREFRGIKKFMSAVGSHPGWVHVLHVGRIETLSCFYYVMELADDASTDTPAPFNPDTYTPKTLRAVLQQRNSPLPSAECVELAISLAEALVHLHRQGLIHRDIKPANVIFVRGLPRFADVGLITAISRSGEEVTQVGTLGYVAPEGPGTEVADLYGLGKLLYVCATGHAVRAFPEPPAGLFDGPDSPTLLGLNDVILRACETDPHARFKNGAALAAALEALRKP